MTKLIANSFKIFTFHGLKRLDWNFILIIAVLQIIGLVNLYSAAYSTNHLNRVFFSQLMWLPISWFVFMITARISYKTLLEYAYFIYAINIGALIWVLFVGKKLYGARRWIDLAVFHYQPSETMKLSLIVFLASYLAKNKLEKFNFSDLLKPLMAVGLPFLLILRQPDLGTAMILLSIASIMILFLKVRVHVLVGIAMILTISLPLAWTYVLKPYQKNRVFNFLNPERDPRGTGYNSIQAKIAIGSGQILGLGFQKGSQNQLEFLPERHSDFIFCVLSEEYGFIGAFFTLSLFFLLLSLIINIAQQSKSRAGVLICVGITAFIFSHVVVNIGMTSGLLPIVGVPLPLLSYGGTSLVTFMAGLGIVANINHSRYMF